MPSLDIVASPCKSPATSLCRDRDRPRALPLYSQRAVAQFTKSSGTSHYGFVRLQLKNSARTSAARVDWVGLEPASKTLGRHDLGHGTHAGRAPDQPGQTREVAQSSDAGGNSICGIAAKYSPSSRISCAYRKVSP